jgi:hypothetical protein
MGVLMDNEAVLMELARKTTEALTIIAESTRKTEENTKAIKENIDKHDGVTNTKLDNLKTLFVYVIMPLLGSILTLVGIKMFKLP